MSATDTDVARFVSVLADHALVEIRCDHDAKQDHPICNCALVDLGWHPSVQAAKEAWALHVFGVLTAPSPGEVGRAILDHLYRSGTHS